MSIGRGNDQSASFAQIEVAATASTTHRARTMTVANAAAGVIAALVSSNYEYETMDWVNGPERRSRTHSSTAEDNNRWTGGGSRETESSVGRAMFQMEAIR
jgi:hypothetical protein